jgi:hypothetical protein
MAYKRENVAGEYGKQAIIIVLEGICGYRAKGGLFWTFLDTGK